MTLIPYAVFCLIKFFCLTVLSSLFETIFDPVFHACVPSSHAGEIDAGPEIDPAIENDTAGEADSLESFGDIEGFDDDWEEDGKSGYYTWRMFIESDHTVAADADLDAGDANLKNEIRCRFESRYGTDEMYLFAVPNLYMLATFLDSGMEDDVPYTTDDKVYRNLRFSTETAELTLNELYASRLWGSARIRIGNQIYGWGTADSFNPTSYFNPFDLRELLFKDDDEIKVGVPSVSGLFFLDGFTLEAVWVPVHVPGILPSSGSFWAAKSVEGKYPLFFDEPDPLSVSPDHMGFGVRCASTFAGMDFSVSGYHGPDKEPVILPERTVLQANQPVGVLLVEDYSVVNMVGFDFSMNLDAFVVQVEAVYSPDKSGFIRQVRDDVQNIEFPFDTERSDYFSYSAGFNYFIPLGKLIEGHEGETVFTVEFAQSEYLDDDINPSFFTDLLSLRFQDSFFSGRLNTSVTAVIETGHGDSIFWPEVKWDFQNGLTLSLAYAVISGDNDGDWHDVSVFSYFDDNDVVMWRVRYEWQ